MYVHSRDIFNFHYHRHMKHSSGWRPFLDELLANLINGILLELGCKLYLPHYRWCVNWTVVEVETVNSHKSTCWHLILSGLEEKPSQLSVSPPTTKSNSYLCITVTLFASQPWSSNSYGKSLRAVRWVVAGYTKNSEGKSCLLVFVRFCLKTFTNTRFKWHVTPLRLTHTGIVSILQLGHAIQVDWSCFTQVINLYSPNQL